MSNEMKAGTKKGYNFGSKGWTVIGFETILLFFMTGITVDGLNTIVPMMAAYHEWNADVLLSISTPASIIALFICALWGGLMKKFGLKKTMVTTIFLGAVSLILYGNSMNVAMYAVTLVCVVVFINAMSLNCGFALVANWFPTKNGIVMGLVTIGMNLASALINWVISGLSTVFAINGALTALGIILAVIGLLITVLVKDTPEKAGCYPDNDPAVAEMLANQPKKDEGETMSYGDALKSKYVWIFGIGCGCFGMATVGIMSQLVSYFMDVRSYTQSGALSMVTIAAVIGMVGAWLWGTVDQKIGAQKCGFLFGVWYLVGIFCLIIPNNVCLWIGMVMLGMAIGGNGHFPGALAAQTFGREEFGVSFSCLNTICGVVRSCSFAILAILRSMTSGYTLPYIVFAIVACIGGILIIAVRKKAAAA